MDLYIDGNIAQMFSPEGAMRYFTRLFGVDARSLRPTVSQERPYSFFILSPAVENARPPFAVNGRPLDYAISQAGTVVPQRMWSPTDARRVSLNMPIFFLNNDCVTLGIPLLKAVGRDRAMLLGARDTAPVGNATTLYLRINWPGYNDWSSQIMTRDQTIVQNTITLEQFAKRVANAVGRFLDEAQLFEGQDPHWRVGAGRGIIREDVILIGIVQVSQGSWQPILQLNRYVMPRCQHIPGFS